MNDTPSASSMPESRVLVVMTGGTMCMVHSQNGLIPTQGFLESGLAPRPSFNDGSNPGDIHVVIDDMGTQKAHRSLRTPLSRYHKHIHYTVYEFEVLLDSSSINANGWSQIASCILNNYQIFDAFIVIHGTDSLAYTCSALSFMLQSLGKPVILTGSQAPMVELQNDATDNLLGSLIIGGHFMIPEVCLFFNYNLCRGNRTTKFSASDFAAFASPNLPPLATISSLQVSVAWNLVYRPKEFEPFSIQTKNATGDVACLRIFPGIRPEMIDSVLQLSGLKGLVLETFGAGNAPGDAAMASVMAAAIQKGIIIVNVTQCMTGTVSPLYEAGAPLRRAGVIPGYDMTSEAALSKLSYLLALPDLTTADRTQMMSRSLRGEITEQSSVTFEHPSVSPNARESLTSLSYAISGGDLGEVKRLLKGNIGCLLNDADYGGNTPLHIAATGPSQEILHMLLANGASVHLRNNAGRTPLFRAANAGLTQYVSSLRDCGAHLHKDEMAIARLLAQGAPAIWQMAGAVKI